MKQAGQGMLLLEPLQIREGTLQEREKRFFGGNAGRLPELKKQVSKTWRRWMVHCRWGGLAGMTLQAGLRLNPVEEIV